MELPSRAAIDAFAGALLANSACCFGMESRVSEALHPAAPHHLPGFITAPGETDVLMIAVGIFLIGAVLAVGNFYLHLHTMPERMAVGAGAGRNTRQAPGLNDDLSEWPE